MPFTGPREDKEAIRELYARYSDASASANLESFLSCFTSEGQWNTHIFRKRGTQALKNKWEELWLAFEKVGFLTEIGSIEVDGNSALCRCVAREVIRLKSGGLYKLIGQYHDRIERGVDGEWRFLSRDYAPIAEEIES